MRMILKEEWDELEEREMKADDDDKVDVSK